LFDSPYVHLTEEGFKECAQYMKDPDQVVVSATRVALIIDYPLEKEVSIHLDGDCKTGFTRLGLARMIAQAYQDIYNQEAETTTLPIESVAERSGGQCRLLNRAETNGTYGIWGHDLEDLDLHTVHYDPDQQLIWLGVDS